MRAGIPYVDVAAEIEANADTFTHFANRAADTVVVPAMAAPDASAPAAVDESGRSAQTFVVDVIVRAGGAERRVSAAGQDIYAVTAPLAVEAVDRILTGRTRATGVVSSGAVFDAPDFLRAMSPHLSPRVPVDTRDPWHSRHHVVG